MFFRQVYMEQKIICIGTALIDSIIRGFDPEPVSAAGYRAESCSLNAGGEAVNEAIALAKLGVVAKILCFLGEDGVGKLVKKTLWENGVDTSLIVREKEHPTPVTTMFVNADGTRKSITNAAHRYNFHPEQYCSCFKQAKAIILGSLFRAPFDDVQIVGDVIAEAKAQGLLVFADTKLPNYRVLSLKDLAPVLPMIDYITPYEIKAMDATGAGDNFIAGLASELLRGSSIREALRFANACGAICTTQVGAGTALRSRAQVLEFLRQRVDP